MDGEEADKDAPINDGAADGRASGINSLYKQRADDTMASVINWLCILGVLLAVYCLGVLGLSVLWVLVGVALSIWREMTREQGRRRATLHRGFHDDERKMLMATMSELPSWVTFSDNERVEWINKIIERFWPYLNGHLKAWCMTSLQSNIQVTHPALASFRFVNVDLGDIPPRIGGVKVYTENTQRDELYLDLDLRFYSSSSLRCKVKGVPLGVNDLQMSGPLRLVFKPLTSQMPLFGCMNIFFLDNPIVDFNLDFAANVLDIPGLHGLIRGVIIENIAWIMVAPSRIAIPMLEGVNTKILKYPPPQGVVRLVVVEARDLESTDSSLFGRGLSDPYVIVKVADITHTTKVVYNNLNPTWDETIELCIDSTEGRVVELDVYDYDVNSRDDHIGHASLDINEVAKSEHVNLWLPLEGVKKGSIHVTARWLYLSQNPASFTKQAEKSEVSTCILIVNLDSAHEMPQLLGKEVLVGSYVNLNKRNKEQKLSSPVVHCILSVGKCKKESWERMNEYNRNPVWEQNFRFFVQNPFIQNLDLQFQDLHLAKRLGTLTIPLKSLLREPDMTVHKNFKLENSGGKSSVALRASLRILTNEKTEYSEHLLTPPTVSLNTEKGQKDVTEVVSNNNPEVKNKTKEINQKNANPSKQLGDSNKINDAAKADTVSTKASNVLNDGNGKLKMDKPLSKTSDDSAQMGTVNIVKKKDDDRGQDSQNQNTSTNKSSTDSCKDEKITKEALPIDTARQRKMNNGDVDTISGAVSESGHSLPSEKLMRAALPTAAIATLIPEMQYFSSKSEATVSLQIEYYLDLKKEKFDIKVAQCKTSVFQGSSAGIYIKMYLLSEKDAVLAERKTEVQKGVPLTLKFAQHLEFPALIYLSAKNVRISAKQKKGGRTIGTTLFDKDEFLKNTADKNYIERPGNVTAYLLSVDLYDRSM